MTACTQYTDVSVCDILDGASHKLLIASVNNNNNKDKSRLDCKTTVSKLFFCRIQVFGLGSANIHRIALRGVAWDSEGRAAGKLRNCLQHSNWLSM
jgi:hypothetical protein